MLYRHQFITPVNAGGTISEETVCVEAITLIIHINSLHFVANIQ